MAKPAKNCFSVTHDVSDSRFTQLNVLLTMGASRVVLYDVVE